MLKISLGSQEAMKIEEVRNRAWGFLLKLLEETEKLLPPNMAVFKQHSFFSPDAILRAIQMKFGQMPFIDCWKVTRTCRV
jgi:hypothetical protein